MVKKSKISQDLEEAVKSRIKVCEKSGRLLWLKDFYRASAGDFADKFMPNGYLILRLSVDGTRTSIMAHRVVWFLYHGYWPEDEIDHINTIKDDNRIENLREATRLQNTCRSGRVRSNGLPRGVTYAPQSNSVNPYVVQIGNRYKGYYPTVEAAQIAYDKFYDELYGNEWRHN